MIQSVQQATQAASETVRALRGLTSPFFPSNAFMASARSSKKSPHLSFMLMKDHWFKELYQGLKVAARTESFIKTIEGQVRCITAEFKPNWCQCSVECQLQCVHPSLDGPASVPKCRNSRTVMGVKSLRPTWFEDAKTACRTHAWTTPHHQRGSLEEVAKRGLLAPETWHCNRPQSTSRPRRCASLRNSHRAEWRRMP